MGNSIKPRLSEVLSVLGRMAPAKAMDYNKVKASLEQVKTWLERKDFGTGFAVVIRKTTGRPGSSLSHA